MGFDDDAGNVIEADACFGFFACWRIASEGPASIKIRAGACGKKTLVQISLF